MCFDLKTGLVLLAANEPLFEAVGDGMNENLTQGIETLFRPVLIGIDAFDFFEGSSMLLKVLAKAVLINPGEANNLPFRPDEFNTTGNRAGDGSFRVTLNCSHLKAGITEPPFALHALGFADKPSHLAVREAERMIKLLAWPGPVFLGD